MNLVIDIGNTRLKAAIFDQDELVDVIYFSHDEWQQLPQRLSKYDLKNGIISSVADANLAVEDVLKPLQMNLLILNDQTKLPIIIDYKDKQGSVLGLDRVADAVAIYSLSKKKNKLIIDAGTCITYNYIFDNQFQGGAISPGLNMRYQSLNTFTDRLPLIQERRFTNLIGSSTKESIQSGVINGIIMEIQGICDQFVSQYETTDIFLTGGDGIFFAEGLKNTIFADPFLTLKGLNNILVFNER